MDAYTHNSTSGCYCSLLLYRRVRGCSRCCRYRQIREREGQDRAGAFMLPDMEAQSQPGANLPEIPRLKNPDSAPPVRVFRAYSAPIPRRPACSHGGRGPARSRVRAPPRRALPRRAYFCNDYITVTKTVTLTKKVMTM